MARVAPQQHARELLGSEVDRSIVAHLHGGPCDGKEFVLYRARAIFTPRVSRGTLRRALRRPPRYAWYELGDTWEEDSILHGDYRFLDVRHECEPLDRAA
jgi:hypothetical protein